MNKKAKKAAKAMKKTTAKKVAAKKPEVKLSVKKAVLVTTKKNGIEELIAQAKPETFIEMTLPALLALRGGKPKKSPLADFEAIWGHKPPKALAGAIELFAKHGFPGFGDFQTSQNDITIPRLPAKPAANVFLAMIAEDQDNSLVPNFSQLLSNCIVIGETGGGDIYFASLIKEEPYIYLLNHENGALESSPCASDPGSFLMMQALCEYQDELPDTTMATAIEKLRKRVVLGELKATAKRLKINSFYFESETQTSAYLFHRSFWILTLLGNLGLSDLKLRFQPSFNELDDKSFALLLIEAKKDVSAALYGILRTFYFNEEERFGKMQAVCLKHASKVVRDTAVWLDCAQRGKEKKLGLIKDIAVQRERVLGLGFAPAGKAKAKPGGSEDALAAFPKAERSHIKKLVELRNANDELKSGFGKLLEEAKKLSGDDRFVQYLIARALDHEKLPGHGGYDAMTLLSAVKAKKNIEALAPLLEIPYDGWDWDFRDSIIAHFGEVKSPAVTPLLVDFIKKHPKTIKANDDSFRQGVEANILALACKALGEIGGSQAIAALEAVAGEKADIFADARAEALVSLAKLGSKNAIVTALAWVKEYGGVPKLAVMWALGALGITAGETEQKYVLDILQKQAFQNWNVNSGVYFAKMLLARHALTRFGIPSPALEKDAKELLTLHEKRMGDGPEICRWTKIILDNKYETAGANVSGDTSIKLEVDKFIKAKKEKAAADLLIGHFGSGKVEDVSQFTGLVDGLVMSLGDSDPARSVRLFASYKDAGGIADCSMYSNYTYAACFTEDENMMRRTISDFNSDMEKFGKEFMRETSDYSTTLCNIAALYAKLHDKGNMLGCLKKVKKYHYDYESLKDEEDFADYHDDPDFLKLFD